MRPRSAALGDVADGALGAGALPPAISAMRHDPFTELQHGYSINDMHVVRAWLQYLTVNRQERQT